MRWLNVLFQILMLLSIAGCSAEKQLARKYVDTHKGNAVMIVPVYTLFKDNSSISYDTSYKYNQEQLDSIAWAQSCFVKYISDSVFLTTYTNSLINELSTYGYDVYVDGSADVFLSLSDPKWLIQLEQMQLTESHTIDYQTIYSLDGSVTYEPYRQNKVDFGTWFHLNRANSESRQLLYLNTYVQDRKVSLVALTYGNNAGVSKNDSVRLDHVYLLAAETGRKQAELIFDYFMN